MVLSIFPDKEKKPADEDLQEKIPDLFPVWKEIKEYIYDTYPKVSEEWNFPGVKYGWSFRMASKKRRIMYFLPRDGYFQVAFIFGKRGTEAVLSSSIPGDIKQMLREAKVYAEGRGIRFDVDDPAILPTIKDLITLKMDN